MGKTKYCPPSDSPSPPLWGQQCSGGSLGLCRLRHPQLLAAVRLCLGLGRAWWCVRKQMGQEEDPGLGRGSQGWEQLTGTGAGQRLPHPAASSGEPPLATLHIVWALPMCGLCVGGGEKGGNPGRGTRSPPMSSPKHCRLCQSKAGEFVKVLYLEAPSPLFSTDRPCQVSAITASRWAASFRQEPRGHLPEIRPS